MVERRTKPRINCSYPATVRGINGCGDAFTEPSCVDNLSASGMSLLLTHPVVPGSELLVDAILSSSEYVEASRIQFRSMVLRTELTSDGHYRVSLVHRRYHFF